MSTRWRHMICAECFFRMNQDVVTPAGEVEAGDEVKLCCYCRTLRRLWFYVRAAPELVPCHGVHTDEQDNS